MNEYIQNKIKTIIELHQTKNIYLLCKIYNINILYLNIKKKGVFIPDKKEDFIFVKKGLSKQEEENIIIHEFSHSILHREELLLLKNLIFKVEKEEKKKQSYL